MGFEASKEEKAELGRCMNGAEPVTKMGRGAETIAAGIGALGGGIVGGITAGPIGAGFLALTGLSVGSILGSSIGAALEKGMNSPSKLEEAKAGFCMEKLMARRAESAAATKAEEELAAQGQRALSKATPG